MLSELDLKGERVRKVISNLVRPEIRELTPYSAHQGNKEGLTILDGNESPYPLPPGFEETFSRRLKDINLNRYPGDDYYLLRQKIAHYLNQLVEADQIILGNGSDEVLQFIINTFINKGDSILSLSPTFSMYKIFTQMAGGNYISFPLQEGGIFDLAAFLKRIEEIKPRLVFICSPNNPTGTKVSIEVLSQIAEELAGILVVDEAYGEFSSDSMTYLVNQHPNLIVTRTFSKAFGLAGARLGYMVAGQQICREVSKVVSPYHLNSLTAIAGETILEYEDMVRERVEEIVGQRKRLEKELENASGFRIYPSDANFIFLRGPKTEELSNLLARENIKIRNFKPPLEDAIRITIGSPEENDKVIDVIRVFNGGSNNEAEKPA